ncbi:MAG: M48 family peptidase [Sphingobacteriales bacterium]|nr:MAG: M48 family peptidase [Sphingobacteriales bacterium]
MQPQTIFYIILAIIIFNFLLERVLAFLNEKNWSATLPDELKAFYDEAAYAKSQQYHKEKNRLALFSETFGFIVLVTFLCFGGFGKTSIYLRQFISDPILLALVYFGVLSFAGSILSFPFSLYNTFVIEEKYGFNRITTRTYILDKIKGLILAIVVGGILGYVILWLILTIGADFWWYAWILFAVLMLFINLFYTSLIVPIFNKLSPLEGGSLRSKIEAYSKSVNFPLTNIMVLDGSKRSSKANAFFSGIGSSKKIVLYDTLIQKHTEEEVVAVLAHEVGHYKKKHVVKGLIIGLIQTSFTLWLLSKFVFNKDLSFALGESSWQLHVNLLAFSTLYEPISVILGLLMNLLSRKHEYEADNFAARTADKQSFSNALIRLSTDTLSNLKPHPAYVFFHYSHPTLLQRLRGLG